MVIYPHELMDALSITNELAAKALRLFNPEELAAANPKDLELVLSCHELLARKIVAYAKIKTRFGTMKPGSGAT